MKKIKKLTKKQWILLLAILAATALGAAGFYLTGGTEVVLADAALRDVYEVVEEAGQVESRSAVTVVAKGSGTVGEILVKEGQSVLAGDLILSFSDFAPTSEVAGIRAQAQGVYAQYIAAKALSDSNRILYEEGAVSQMEYTQSLAVTRQLSAQLASLGYSADSLNSATGADGVVSPLSGVITAVYVREGETAAPGASLAEVGGLEDRIVLLHMISSDADQITEGMHATVLADGDEITDQARVDHVGIKATDHVSSLGIVQKRVRVEVALPEEATPRLGSSVDVRIIVREALQVVSVPSAAVFQIEEASWVYVAAGGKAVQTPVIVGLEGEEYVEIIEGLSAGDRVLASPPSDLTDGTRIKEK
ncbi:MAG: efflux RND transporter periplasmic adaptor subunit [Eubacteriales bacterium]|nr:efflux RND transporter periplasmic adaptor subunit [Eubacteriales bacterium]MDD3864045.1 efflux RND transporter periplasmic adaptor subunit [Eubacteriales bacterium]